MEHGVFSIGCICSLYFKIRFEHIRKKELKPKCCMYISTVCVCIKSFQEKVNCYVACAKKKNIDAKIRFFTRHFVCLFCAGYKNYNFTMKL
jgi:hypothetical protein